MADAITTTRAGNGALTTTTPGVPSTGNGQLLAALIQQRQAQQNYARAHAPIQARAQAPAEPQYESRSSGADPKEGWSAPNGGQPQVVTRTVKDPFADPYTKMATGFDIGSRQERGFVDKNGNVQWEFEDIRPHGRSGGIIGGGAESSLHPDEAAKANMRVPNATGTPNEAVSQPVAPDPNEAVRRAPVSARYDAAKMASGARGQQPVVVGRR